MVLSGNPRDLRRTGCTGGHRTSAHVLNNLRQQTKGSHSVVNITTNQMIRLYNT